MVPEAQGPISPAVIFLACRRLAHVFQAIEFFESADANPETADQFEADRYFLMGVMNSDAVIDNCANFMNEFLDLGFSRSQIDFRKDKFLKKLEDALPDLADSVGHTVKGDEALTVYRNACVHNSAPLVLHGSDLGCMVVAQELEGLDSVTQLLNLAAGETRPVSSALALLRQFQKTARGVLAAVCRHSSRSLAARGFSPPNQPSPGDFGRAFIRLVKTGDMTGSDTGPVLTEFIRNAQKLQNLRKS